MYTQAGSVSYNNSDGFKYVGLVGHIGFFDSLLPMLIRIACRRQSEHVELNFN